VLENGDDISPEYSELAQEMVNKIFTTKASPLLQQCGLLSLAPGTKSGGYFSQMYLSILLALPDSDRQYLLGLNKRSVGDKSIITSNGKYSCSVVMMIMICNSIDND